MRTTDQCWRRTKIPFAAHMRGHICSTRSCSMSTAFRWHPWAAQVSLEARAPCRQGQPQPRPRRTRYGGPWRCNGALPSQLEKPKCSEWRFGYVSSKNWYPDVPRWTSKWLVNGAGALGVLGAVVLRSKDRTNEELPLQIPLAPMTLGCFGSEIHAITLKMWLNERGSKPGSIGPYWTLWPTVKNVRSQNVFDDTLTYVCWNMLKQLKSRTCLRHILSLSKIPTPTFLVPRSVVAPPCWSGGPSVGPVMVWDLPAPPLTSWKSSSKHCVSFMLLHLNWTTWDRLM